MRRFRTILLCLFSLLSAWAQAAELQIGVKPGLKFDVPGFHAQPGETVKLTFTNNDEMMHNIVFTHSGVRLKVVEAAIALGAEGPAKHFVPDLPEVWASTPVVMPGQRFVLDFKAPQKEGEYPYVCTFPGHGFVMYGTLFVAKKRPAKLDAILKQAATQPVAQQTELPLSKAKLVRTFMPGSSPAAIAVALPGGHAYCWDAGNCRLRYAWRGGFIQRNGTFGRWRTLPDLLGPVYYREAELPFRMGDKPDEPPMHKFLGYRFIDGIPEFRYSLGDCEVRESIAKLPGRSGLMRRFSITGAKAGVLFRRDAWAGVAYTANQGIWKGDTLHLTPAEAAGFTLEMVEVPGLAPAQYWSMDDLTRHYSRKGRLAEGHLGRAWQFSGGPVIPTEHSFENFDDAFGLSFWIRVGEPTAHLPTICGWGEGGNGPVLSYDGEGFRLGTAKEAPVPLAGQLEAEAAQVQGAGKVNSNRGHTGSGYVDFKANSGESIEWNFKVEDGGEYLLRFRYALPGGGRPLKVELDDTVLVPSYPFADSGEWESWRNADIPAKLGPGKHVVRLSSIGSSGPNVDHLIVLKAGQAQKKTKPPASAQPPAVGKPLLGKEAWHHVVVSVTGGEATFYLDGTRLRAEPFSAEGFAEDADFFLGPKLRGGSFELDEFRLYSRPLPPTEVKELIAR